MSSLNDTWSESSEDNHDEFFKSLLSFMDESGTEADETSGYESFTSDNSGAIPCGYFQHFCAAVENENERKDIPIYKQCDRLPKPQVTWSDTSTGCIFSVIENPTRNVISCANSILTQREPFSLTHEEVHSHKNYRDSVFSKTKENAIDRHSKFDETTADIERFDEHNWHLVTRSSTPLRGRRCVTSSFNNNNDSGTTRLKTELFIMLLKNKNLPELANHPQIESIMGNCWRDSLASTLTFKITSPSWIKTHTCASDDSFTSSATSAQISSESTEKDLRSPNTLYTTIKKTTGASCTPPTGPFCKFCYKNGETEKVYKSHVLRADDGTVSCPVLMKYVCEICGATGKDSHTRKYCPKFSENQSKGGSSNKPTYRRLTNGFWTQNLYHK